MLLALVVGGDCGRDDQQGSGAVADVDGASAFEQRDHTGALAIEHFSDVGSDIADLLCNEGFAPATIPVRKTSR